MVKQDEDALICDFAEFYHVYDYKALPLPYAAVLFFGLRANSRCKIILSGDDFSLDTNLSVLMVDALNLLVWMQSRDGQKGVNRPQRLSELLMKKEKVTNNNILSFSSAEEFEKERERRIRKWQQS